MLQAEALASGSVISHFGPSHLRRMVIPIPPTHVQKTIAQTLGVLDDKIDLNRRMNETLEAMARATFEDWFDKSDTGRRAKVDELAQEGVLLIGDGYRAKNDELGAPGLPFIRAANLNNGFDTEGAEVLNQRSVALAGGKLSQAGDVAFTAKGTIGRFARVGENVERFVYSPQVCFWRSLDSARLRPSILYCWMVSDDLKQQIDAVSGQTDMAPYVSLRDQRQMTMPRFDESQHGMADVLDSLLARQSANSSESRIIATLRDLLLPKLMSGEIRIREAEKIMEAVA